MARKRRNRKGFFGRARHPVARDYVVPDRRRRAVGLGLLVAVAVLGYAIFDHFSGSRRFVSAGPLSSAHATLEKDCGACHRDFEAVTSERCNVCHEKLGDEVGVYSFASHYLYRSNDFQRVVPSPDETSCASCHQEHGGRQASITQVSDLRCRACHEITSFEDDHPAFQQAATPERTGLRFAHGEHVEEVMTVHALVDVERACLHCHNPQPDGRGFAPIAFDRHCDACHLTVDTVTPRLPLADDAAGTVGVASLDDIRRRGGADTDWARFTNPNEFRRVGSRVSKSPVHHRDPWILDNLRRLRQRLHPDAGLADLLVTTPDAPAHEVEGMYREAVDTLRRQALGLRNRPEPEIQADLARIEAILAELERQLADPYVALDETELLVALDGAVAVGPGEAAEIDDLVASLTSPCTVCHEVVRATIARVQHRQDQLRRADFDHRAHILQSRCLDCHSTVPTTKAGSEDPRDRTEFQHLPPIETCQECHNERLASDRCVTCHRFHPDQHRKSDFLLYQAPNEDRGSTDG